MMAGFVIPEWVGRGGEGDDGWIRDSRVGGERGMSSDLVMRWVWVDKRDVRGWGVVRVGGFSKGARKVPFVDVRRNYLAWHIGRAFFRCGGVAGRTRRMRALLFAACNDFLRQMIILSRGCDDVIIDIMTCETSDEGILSDAEKKILLLK